MSAAAPPPPPHRYLPGAASDAKRYSVMTVPGRSGNAGGGGIDASTNGQPRPPRTLPHVYDLALRAKERINPSWSLEKLLHAAGEALRQADPKSPFRRPDEAYVEYLMAANIVAEVIPYKFQPMLRDRPRLKEEHRYLVEQVNAKQADFDRVKDMIDLDNARTGVQPTKSSIQAAQPRQTSPENPRKGLQAQIPENRPSSLYVRSQRDQASTSPGASHRNSVVSPFSQDLGLPPPSPKHKPPVRPKPQELHGTTIGSNTPASRSPSASADALAERFSRLRSNGSETRVYQQQSSWPAQSPKYERMSTDMHSPTDSIRSSYFPTGGSSSAISSKTNLSKTTVSTQASARSTPPIITHLSKALPKPPSPAYSPSRDAYATTSVPPPRGTPRRPSGTYVTYSNASGNSTAVSISTSQDSGGDVSDNHNQDRSQTPVPHRRRKSMNMPQETEISAERLYDYLRTFAVLVIDVRSREDFDAGHIFAQHILCVEPAQLRSGMSADELQDSLVLSPELEQMAFDRRNDYDLVVYYDESSKSTDYLHSRGSSHNSIAMKCLHDCLFEFNEEKPLQWPPVLLVGGITAWADLVGAQALQTSNTAPIIRAQTNRPPRAVARNSLARNSSMLTVQKKRHRDYNPLDAEEEKKWRERARSESVNLDQLSLDLESREEEGEGQPSPLFRSVDDFYQRFPDVAAVERQSMVTSPPLRPLKPPPPPPSLTINYPTVPPIPSVPTRPAPAMPRESFRGVSERLPPQTGALERSAQLPPYIPPQYQPRNVRLPRTGLHNFGVTCYMNATIQCLSATLALSTFFLTGAYKSRIQADNWKGSKGLMPELYSTLLGNLWQGDVDTIRPTNFRKFCARLNAEWGVDRQQDAKEFLEFLVDYLHEDLNINWARTPLKELTPAEEAIRENTPPFVAAKREWSRYTHRDLSYLTDLFGGQHISRLRCTTCGHSSTTYEPFTSISVEIPHQPSSQHPLSIYDCLRSYSSTETLSGAETWKCPHCARSREATKRLTITRAPEHLVVHFKRFSASRSEKAKKVHAEIAFPLHGLDITPFVLPAPDAAQAAQIERAYGAEALRADAAMAGPYRYDAYAVLRHIGTTLSSGHYVALVKDPVRRCWRRFDDDRVTDFVPEELPRGRGMCNGEAYIVFYQRVRS